MPWPLPPFANLSFADHEPRRTQDSKQKVTACMLRTVAYVLSPFVPMDDNEAHAWMTSTTDSTDPYTHVITCI